MEWEKWEIEVIQLLETFVANLDRSGCVDAPHTIVQKILAWTNGQPELTSVLCQQALQSLGRTIPDEEEQWVDALVHSLSLNPCENTQLAQHLQQITDRILTCDRAPDLLKLYRSIATKDNPLTSNSSDEKILLEMGLIAKRQGQLAVHNRLYAETFNQTWFEQALSRMRPQKTPKKKLIADRYKIQKLLGRGGFGRTFQALDTQLNQPCVLKELLRNRSNDTFWKKSLSLFKREANVLKKVEHPQIPQFIDWLKIENRSFLVQEYIDGETYAALLEKRKQQGHAFSESEVIQLLLDLLPVLDYIHRQNIIHRDISPDNIIQPRNENPKPVLIDFGSVRHKLIELQSKEPNSSDVASDMTFIGKKVYAPPEQIRFAQCFPSSDLYALGVTVVVLLTGQKPRDLVHKNAPEWQWKKYVNISSLLVEVLEKMLADQPKDRYQSAKEVLEILQSISSTLPVTNQANNDSKAKQELQSLSNPDSVPDADLLESESSDVFADENSSDTDSQSEQTTANQSLVENSSNALLSSQKQYVLTRSKNFEQLVCLAWSADDRTIASLVTINARSRIATTVKRCDIGTRQCTESYLPSNAYRSITFNSDGNLIAIGCFPAGIKVIDTLTKKPLYPPLMGHPNGVRHLAVCSHGQTLASSDKGGEVRLWDLRNGQLMRKISSHSKSPRAIALSADGQVLMTVDSDNLMVALYLRTSRLVSFPLASHRLKRLFLGRTHKLQIHAVAISPNGKFLASGDNDGEVKIWDILAQKHISTMTSHSNKIVSLRFNSTGSMLAGGNQDGEIRIWDLSDI